MGSLVIPPLAMNMETEEFTPQRIAYLQLQTLMWFCMNEKESELYHIKIVCSTDKELIGFRKGYDQLLLEYFQSQKWLKE